MLKKSLINTARSETPEISDCCLQYSMGAIKEATAYRDAGKSRTIIINEGFFMIKKKSCYKKVPLILPSINLLGVISTILLLQ